MIAFWYVVLALVKYKIPKRWIATIGVASTIVCVLNMMYLDEEELAFAQASDDHLEESEKVIHKDSNGSVLANGDNVVLIKDLKVKGTSMTAKQGTVVRKITLDPENAEYIEGKVDGQQIVILTQYVKKA